MNNTPIKISDRVSIYDFPPARVTEICNENECMIRGEGICGTPPVRVWKELLNRR